MRQIPNNCFYLMFLSGIRTRLFEYVIKPHRESCLAMLFVTIEGETTPSSSYQPRRQDNVRALHKGQKQTAIEILN